MRCIPWLLLLIAPCALADDGVLVEHVSTSATQQVVLAVVKTAMINRRWTIDDMTASSVTASISRHPLKATLTITYAYGRVLYNGDATRMVQIGPIAGTVQKPASVNIPANWLAYLRRDISLALAAIPDPKPSS